MYGIDVKYPTVKKYAEAKIDMLRKDFRVRVPKSTEERILAMTSETEVDRACRQLIMDRLK